METLLSQLNFNRTTETDIVGYSKAFPGKFVLFVARNTDSNKWIASITVGTIEISIPGTVDGEWVSYFVIENLS